MCAGFNGERAVFFGGNWASLAVRARDADSAVGRPHQKTSSDSQPMASDRSNCLLSSGFNPQPQPTMASISDRLSTNITGRFFVDSSCIGRDGDNGTSFVMKQPVTAEEIALVEQAAANCATGSIGEETAG
jgi:hypothetical protein